MQHNGNEVFSKCNSARRWRLSGCSAEDNLGICRQSTAALCLNDGDDRIPTAIASLQLSALGELPASGRPLPVRLPSNVLTLLDRHQRLAKHRCIELTVIKQRYVYIPVLSAARVPVMLCNRIYARSPISEVGKCLAVQPAEVTLM